MIQIDEPPDIAGCAPCGQPLLWLWSPRREAWVSVVPGPEPDLLKIHACKGLQDFATWRQVRRPDPPSPEYLAWKNKNTSKESR